MHRLFRFLAGLSLPKKNRRSAGLISYFSSRSAKTGLVRYPEKFKDEHYIILVKNLPTLADDELLEIFFESEKKQGGGPVKSVTIFSDKNVALVEFCEESSVETVLKKMPIKFGKTELDIMPYKGLLADKIAIDHVDIRGLDVPQEFTHDLLEIHLGYSGQVLTSGPATMLKVGSRVVRGKDWKFGDQDNNGPGTVVKVPIDKATGWFIVKWDGGGEALYRMGLEGCYDLMLQE